MSKLPYQSIAALLADFKAGAKFEVVGAAPALRNGPIKEMHETTDAGRILVAIRGNFYRADGGHFRGESRKGCIVKVADAPALDVPPKIAAPSPGPRPAPFLKRFVLGEPAHCPKTRETVKAVEFVNGAINVTLVNGDGIERVSSNYDHEGKHLWRPDRSLIVGPLPPQPKPDVQVDVFLFESLKNRHVFRAFTLGESVNPTLWRQVGYGRLTAEGRQRA